MSSQNAITDLVMLVLPLPSIWHLNTTRSKKIGLTIVFLTGSIGIVASCIRLSVFFGTNAFNDPTCESYVRSRYVLDSDSNTV